MNLTPCGLYKIGDCGFEKCTCISLVSVDDECYPHVNDGSRAKLDELSANLRARNSDNSYLKHVISSIEKAVFDDFAHTNNDGIVRKVTSILTTYRGFIQGQIEFSTDDQKKQSNIFDNNNI